MGYEINVSSKNGQHHFATDPRSIEYSTIKLKEIYNEFLVAYPEEKGYKISVIKWGKIGQPIDMDEILKS